MAADAAVPVFFCIRLYLRQKNDMVYDDEAICCCALNRIFGFKPKIALALISAIGSAAGIFRLGSRELENILGKTGVSERMNMKTLDETAKEVDMLSRQGYSFTYISSPDYPALLKECEDPPVWLYIKSRSSPAEIFGNMNGISVVGTRDISDYGKEWCRRIVSALARASPAPAIISGLALGTDIIAHETALENGIPTVAVMATGIDSVYPARHRKTADRIAATEGCALITDYPPGTVPLQINFLRRNRIIAGISSATVLVESKAKGGGMLTARLAFSYSRDVYALPGRADDIRSMGCNMLIRGKIAEPVLSGQALVESIGLKYSGSWMPPDPLSSVQSTYDGKIEADKIGKLSRIVLAIRKQRGVTMDELSHNTGLAYREVLELTALLECDGIIRTDLQQRCYIRLK